MTYLQLLQSGLIVVALLVIHGWIDPETPLEMAWAFAFTFCVGMASWFALLLVVRGAQRPDSRWNKAVSDTAGQRIMSAALGTWIVLVTLLFVGYEGEAISEAPWLAIAGAIALVAAFVIAHRFERRGVRHPLMPYAIATTCVSGLFIPLVFLRVSGM